MKRICEHHEYAWLLLGSVFTVLNASALEYHKPPYIACTYFQAHRFSAKNIG